MIQIVSAIEINDRWFLEGQQFYFRETSLLVFASCYTCSATYPSKQVRHYIVDIGGVDYPIPEFCVAVLDGVPSADMRGPHQRLHEEETSDITGDKNHGADMVADAKRFLGIDIKAKGTYEFQGQVRGSDLARLNAAKAKRGIDQGRAMTENEIRAHPDIPPMEQQKEFDHPPFENDFN